MNFQITLSKSAVLILIETIDNTLRDEELSLGDQMDLDNAKSQLQQALRKEVN